ncbi:hypothetical protein BaRGS_00008603, partial [Batillaria attramentaria]
MRLQNLVRCFDYVCFLCGRKGGTGQGDLFDTTAQGGMRKCRSPGDQQGRRNGEERNRGGE